ncbi:hypothetical protein P8452_32637 [Trifolium repens]|nr:hypothetical protein P8452_32637 [Trifolium repens]
METICKKGQFGIHGNRKEQQVLKEFKKPVMETGPLVNHGVFNTEFSRNRDWIGLYLKGSVRIFEVGDQKQISAEFITGQVS